MVLSYVFPVAKKISKTSPGKNKRWFATAWSLGKKAKPNKHLLPNGWCFMVMNQTICRKWILQFTLIFYRQPTRRSKQRPESLPLSNPANPANSGQQLFLLWLPSGTPAGSKMCRQLSSKLSSFLDCLFEDWHGGVIEACVFCVFLCWERWWEKRPCWQRFLKKPNMMPTMVPFPENTSIHRVACSSPTKNLHRINNQPLIDGWIRI